MYNNLITTIVCNYNYVTFIIILSRENALRTLIALATGVFPKNASLNSIDEATIVFENITESILANEEQFIHYDLLYNYLPQFLIEWVICRAWFLYFTQSVQISVSMLKDVIKKIQNIITVNSYPKNQ